MKAVPARSGLILMPTCWAEQAASHHAAAADLTEELAHRLWLDDRTAYVIIGQAVSTGVWSTAEDGGGAVQHATRTVWQRNRRSGRQR